jgi:transposase
MSTPEALRCLKRRLVRVVYNHLTTDQASVAATLTTAA